MEIHALKLDRDFGHPPRVDEIEDQYLTGLHDREMRKLLKEGKSGMETVREHHAVADRLRAVHETVKHHGAPALYLRTVCLNRRNIATAELRPR